MALVLRRFIFWRSAFLAELVMGIPRATTAIYLPYGKAKFLAIIILSFKLSLCV